MHCAEAAGLRASRVGADSPVFFIHPHRHALGHSPAWDAQLQGNFTAGSSLLQHTRFLNMLEHCNQDSKSSLIAKRCDVMQGSYSSSITLYG